MASVAHVRGAVPTGRGYLENEALPWSQNRSFTAKRETARSTERVCKSGTEGNALRIAPGQGQALSTETASHLCAKDSIEIDWIAIEPPICEFIHGLDTATDDGPCEAWLQSQHDGRYGN